MSEKTNYFFNFLSKGLHSTKSILKIYCIYRCFFSYCCLKICAGFLRDFCLENLT